MKHLAWEYLTTDAELLSENQLNELGADGWELVATHDARAIFKRPGLDFRERITIAQRERLGAKTRGRSHEA